jgi:2-polyprenyl-3-methyl-5-hydroxy-6-metoxy-1,4-benzoquinol methylase
MSLEETIQGLPSPFCEGRFHLLRSGGYDSADTEVYLNEEEDFAFLYPRPEMDYVRYKPRVAALELAEYKKSLAVVQRRFEKVREGFRSARSALEIGAGDASFLAHVATQCPNISLASQEIDQNTRPARDTVAGLVQYASLEDVHRSGEHFDVICMFHVLEHIFDPGHFLTDCVACLAPGGRLIIEVPSLDDPLLTLFQLQHPYVYSAGSMTRLLAHRGLEVERAINHQRYGLENHLHWLSTGKPGGSEQLRQIFAGCEAEYMACLERQGRADSFIALVRTAPGD